MINCYYDNYPLACIVAVCGTISIYGISRIIDKLNGIKWLTIIPTYLSWAGKVSMVILCAHTVERYIPIGWQLLGIQHTLPLFIGKVIFCSLVAWAFGKISCTRKLFGI